MSEVGTRAICDAGPLIHLDELGCRSLLHDFDEVVVPEQVWEEVVRHRPEALARSEGAFQRVEVTISMHPSFQSLVRSLALDFGEQAALTDDAAARLAAGTLGYRVHGSIGILIRAIRRGEQTREEVLTLLRALPTRSTLHIRASLLQDIITRVETAPER